MKHFFTSLPGIVLLIMLFQLAPQDPSEKLLAGLKQWYENNPQEKVFVQTDKEQYLSGDVIWLKGWCTIEAKPSFLSRVMYVEVVNSQGSVVAKKMYQLDSLATAAGSIDIPDNWAGGTYAVNAYTLWMLNYKEHVFRKTIFIVNPDTKKENKPATSALLLLNFFPEGGELIENTVNRVAFKATDKYGTPLAIKGDLLDGAGNKIAPLETVHDGMGMLELTPQAGARYKAVVQFNGRAWDFTLPAAKKDGISMQVQNGNPGRLFLVLNTPASSDYGTVHVIGHMGGRPVFSAAFNLREGENGTAIPKQKLPAGILHLTAFDSTGLPLAERLAFIPNYTLLTPAITGPASSAARARNEWTVQAEGAKGNLAVSVTDADAAGNEDRDHIASSLLLTSDLRGYIHNPAYYFRNKDASTLQHLDLLLMTQGWRRFTWKQIRGEEPVALKYGIESLLNIRGKVTKSDRSTPITKGTVDLIIKGDDSTTILSTAYITDKGEFIVDSLFFRRKATVSYMGNNNKNGLPVDVSFYPSHIDSLKQSGFLAQTPAAQLYPDPLSREADDIALQKSKLLETVTVRTKKVSRIDSIQKEYVSPIFELSDNTLEMPENTAFINIWQFLTGRVPGLNVNPFQPGGVQAVSFSRNDGINALSQDAGSDRLIQFYLNEMPVSADVIDAINPSDVALIKIYKGALAFPFGVDGGAISVYTKKGANTSALYSKQFSRTTLQGFELTREFYSPDYTRRPELNKGEKDHRITLFWKSSLKLDAAGSASFQFHNNDRTKKFRVVVQGMDANGNFIFGEKLIQ
jgi:hypothetical protein